MINIRNATPRDIPLLVAFNQSMAMETEGKQLESGLLEKGIEEVFNKPQLGFYLVAEVDNSVVGALMITTEWSDWRNGLFWWIQSVYVEADNRRKGIYRALYSEVKNRASTDSRICGIRLYVERENVTAQKTYASLGMKETHYRLYEEEF